MEWPRLKNIILLLLLLTNLFLAALVLQQEGVAARHQEEAREDVVQLLGRSGIAVSQSVLPRDAVYPIAKVTPEPGRDAAVLTPLLGEVTTSSPGGERFIHIGQWGVADIQSGGAFSLALEPSLFPAGADPAEHARETLKQVGMLTQAEDIQYTQEAGDRLEVTEVTLYEYWGGLPVADCELRAVYTNGNLVSVSGTRIGGVPAETGQIELSAVTGLLRFVEQLTLSGKSCSAITGMIPVYRLTFGLENIGTLTPVWHFETDGGSYLLDPATNDLVTLS